MSKMRSKSAAALLLMCSAAANAANFTVNFGDRFGDGWGGVGLSWLVRAYNSSEQVGDEHFMEAGWDASVWPEAGEGLLTREVCCEEDEAVYFGMVYGDNATLLVNQDEPMQSWEIFYQVESDGKVYNGGWNTLFGISCDENRTVLDWTMNLQEPLGYCPHCAHPKPKPKPKPKHRLLGADDDKKPKPKPPLKYWPFPVKLVDPVDKDGWYMDNSMTYAEYTISDASRMNLLIEGTLCPGDDGYKTVCDNMLPDGHYVFRAAGNLDETSTNYTWQLCGKDVKKSKDDDDGMSSRRLGKDDDGSTKTDDDDGKNKNMTSPTYEGATGGMGNEVSFRIKKGKCIVDEVVTVDDYVNGTALDTVLTLDGHVLLENVHFDSLSPVESSYLEEDLSEFVELDVSKTVSLTSVEDVNDGTLVGFRVVATHAESQLMHGTMDDVIYVAAERLRQQLSGGGFVNYLHNSLEKVGLDNDKLMSVTSASFVDLDMANLVTLRDGETMTGDIVPGGDHAVNYNPIISDATPSEHDSSVSEFMLDMLAASGAFAVVAVVVVLVVVAFKPTTPVSTEAMDNSGTNLVERMDEVIPSAMDTSSSVLLTTSNTDSTDSSFSYEKSLADALSKRWEMNTDESVRL